MTTDKKDRILNAPDCGKVPNLRFPGFVEEWASHPTTDFFEFKNGLNPEAKRFGTGTKFISVMDILNNRYITYDKIISSVIPKKGDLEDFGVNYGDILFQRSSETLEDVGRANVYLDNKTALFGGFVIRGKKKGDYDPLFFRYMLSSPYARKRIVVKGAGAQHFNIGQDELSKVELFVPSLDEQKRIGELFNLLDERIETQSRAIEKLQSLMKGLNNYLQDHVEKEITLSFSEMGSDYSGLTGKTADDFGSGKPFIPYTNVYANTFIDEKNLGSVSVSEGEKQSKVQKGDVVFTLSSETPEEVCYGSVYWGEEKELYLNSFCFGVHITNEKVFPPYLAYFVNSNSFRKAVFHLAQGSTRYNLQKLDFLRKPFPFPSLENQKRIFLVLNAIDKKMHVEQRILESYHQQMSFLLQQMFI